jgi:hypothetical protein
MNDELHPEVELGESAHPELELKLEKEGYELCCTLP